MARAIIERGQQAAFLSEVRERLGLTWKEMAKICKVHDSAVRGWAAEKMNMSHEAMIRLHELSGVPLPLVIEVISETERLRKAGIKGGKKATGGPDRAIIEKGEQGRFLRMSKEQLGVSWEKIAELCGVCATTLRRWVNEEMNMSYEAMLLLQKLSGVPLPPVIEVISVEERLRKAGSKGATTRNKVYGNPGTPEGSRKGARELWRRRRKHPNRYHPIGGGEKGRKEIQIPEYSPELAELVGILLGDGGIRRWEVKVTLHGEKEVEYAEFVARLFEDLFDLTASISVSKWSNKRTVAVYSVALVEYLEGIGLHRGNKVEQQVGVPDWIFTNRAFMEACVRGLMDTDGGPCIIARHRSGRYYVGFRFKNSSRPLIDGMWKMLTSLGYKATKSRKYVNLFRREEVKRYCLHIGISNTYKQQRFLELAWDWDLDLPW